MDFDGKIKVKNEGDLRESAMSEVERERARSREEDDQFARSKKKAKASEEANGDLNASMEIPGVEEIVASTCCNREDIKEDIQTDDMTLLIMLYGDFRTRKKSNESKMEKQSYLERLIGTNGVDNLGDYSDEDTKEDEFSEYEENEENIKENMNELCPRIKVLPEEKIEWCKPWRKSLIIKLIGKKVGICFLISRIERLRRLKGNLELIDLKNDYFLARLGDP
ncbi:hypothetical protein G2W53_010577 [Senna tora]|uniref:Uncharacterized protein n=1 Tax=Senna tora TaxID=362788 RepID=A0A834WZZ8_9FABA|nr:hypothetical protein G2W53_010577 [Senna tora]